MSPSPAVFEPGASPGSRPEADRAMLLAVDGIVPGPGDQASDALLQAAEAAATEAIRGQPLEQLPHVAAWREAYRAFGAKPQRTRNSLEALLRRAASGLPRVNRLTDLYNAVSVLHQLPLGEEDLLCYTSAPRLVRATGEDRGDAPCPIFPPAPIWISFAARPVSCIAPPRTATPAQGGGSLQVSGRATLSAAQLAIAREYGFASWPRLKAEAERRRAEASPSGQTAQEQAGQAAREPDTPPPPKSREEIREWSARLPAGAGDLIAGQYADRPDLRAILDTLLAAVPALGPVTVQARKTFVSLVTSRRTFAVVQATTRRRVDLGLRLDTRGPGAACWPPKAGPSSGSPGWSPQ